MNSRLSWAILLIVSLAFGWGLIELYQLRFVSGDIYPVYSSLRSDPLGSEALFDSLAELPGYSTRRNFRELDRLRDTNATILWLGEDPFTFALNADEDLKQIEDIASRGVRLVFVMAPVKPKPSGDRTDVKGLALERRWGITFEYAGGTPTRELLPKKTALVMKADGQPSPLIEKHFGTGSVVLVGN